jgi:hypothetical protein
VLREGRCVGAVRLRTVVGGVGGGDKMGLVVMCGVSVGGVDGSVGAASGIVAATAVGG